MDSFRCPNCRPVAETALNRVSAVANIDVMKPDLTIRTGQRLRAIREAAGLSSAEVSRATGIAANHITLIERGLRSPTLRKLQQLCDFYRIEPWRVLKHPRKKS
jgi:ribosome-binding protein aMBF1 (putative translation factor)